MFIVEALILYEYGSFVPIPVAVRSQVINMQPLDYWDRGFETRSGHGCSSPVFVVCFVVRGLCDVLITRPEESYRLRLCVCVCLILCNPETPAMRRPKPEVGCSETEKECRICRIIFDKGKQKRLVKTVPTSRFLLHTKSVTDYFGFETGPQP